MGIGGNLAKRNRNAPVTERVSCICSDNFLFRLREQALDLERVFRLVYDNRFPRRLNGQFREVLPRAETSSHAVTQDSVGVAEFYGARERLRCVHVKGATTAATLHAFLIPRTRYSLY